MAAAVESASEHPLAAAILEYAEARMQQAAPAMGWEAGRAASGVLENQCCSEQGSGAEDAATPLVALPSSPLPHTGCHSRRVDWIRDVRDAEATPGKCYFMTCCESRL